MAEQGNYESSLVICRVYRSILDDPKWREIVEKGRTSVQFLRALIIGPTEQGIFSDKPYARALTAGDFNWPLRPS
jgi:hypothetical protein